MARGCARSDFVSGCIGFVIGAGLAIVIQVYLAFAVSNKIAHLYRDRARDTKGIQKEYDRMCGSGAWKHDLALRRICEDLKKQMDANGQRGAAPGADVPGRR